MIYELDILEELRKLNKNMAKVVRLLEKKGGKK